MPQVRYPEFEPTDFDPTATNELYRLFGPSWRLCRDFAEMHEHILRGGEYLDQFGKDADAKVAEAASQYNWRRGASFTLDFCEDLIDLRVGNLFRSPPARNYDRSAYKDFIEQFLADVDGGGTDMDQFMREALRKHYATGVDVVVDKKAPPPGLRIASRWHEDELGLAPYLSTFTPLERVDWACNHANRYVWVRYDLGDAPPADEHAGSGARRYLTLTPQQWRLYEVDGDGGTRVAAGRMAIGRVPVVQFYFRSSGRGDYRGVPLSLLTRVAPVARALLNLLSEGRLDIHMAIGVFLAIGIDPEALPTETAPGCWLGVTGSTPADVQVQHICTAVEHIREKRQWALMLMEAILRMGKVIGATGRLRGRATSGFQVEAERTDLDNEMATTAGQMERLEQRIMALAISRHEGRWIGPDQIGYSVEYNKRYVLTPLGEILDQAQKAFGLGIQDSAPELLRPFLRRALDAIMKPSDPRYAEIARQIATAEWTDKAQRQRQEEKR